MQSHQKKIGNYYLLKPIGVGSFAKVYKGLEEKTSEIVAIKMINKQQFPSEKSDLIEKEVQILKSLSHPNIISILDIKKTQNNIYLIFEYCQMGDLESYIKKCYWDSSKNRAMPSARRPRFSSSLMPAVSASRSKPRPLRNASSMLPPEPKVPMSEKPPVSSFNIVSTPYCRTIPFIGWSFTACPISCASTPATSSPSLASLMRSE